MPQPPIHDPAAARLRPHPQEQLLILLPTSISSSGLAVGAALLVIPIHLLPEIHPGNISSPLVCPSVDWFCVPLIRAARD